MSDCQHEARPLVSISVLCFLHCFDADGWVAGKTLTNPHRICSRTSREVGLEKEPADSGLPGKTGMKQSSGGGGGSSSMRKIV